MLYRDLAPVSKEAWDEIEERLMEVFKTHLSARKVVKVEGPRGWDYNVITEGRLDKVEKESDFCYGNYKVLPLTEVRIEFEMSRWELDNIVRGAKDIDYEPLEKAAKKIALFEDNAVYNGFKKANIEGLVEAAEREEIKFGNDANSILDSIAGGLVELRRAYQEGPFILVVGEDAYRKILSQGTNYPLDKQIEDLTGKEIVYSHALDGALLVPFNHDDLELTIGQDLSIGYQSHDNKKVRFFITESFTFRVLDPSIIVKYKL